MSELDPLLAHDEFVDEPPSPLRRIADALERIADVLELVRDGDAICVRQRGAWITREDRP